MGAGVVLAGGRSTRFDGGDKAVADLAGTPMIRRVVDRIAPVVDEVVVNCRADQRERIAEALAGAERRPTFAVDEHPDAGPMAGMATALGAVDETYALVVACDMPFVDPAFVEYLFGRAAGYDAAVPRREEWFQPTQAVYRAARMADACEAALARGAERIVEPLFDLEYVVVEGDELDRHANADTFENLNTAAEFAAAAERLAEE